VYDICEWEIQQHKPCFTIDTFRHLQTVYKNTAFYFLMGSDSFFTFHTWKDYKAIANEVSLIVVRRDARSQKEYKDYQSRYCPKTQVVITGETIVDVSSTQVKNASKTMFDDAV